MRYRVVIIFLLCSVMMTSLQAQSTIADEEPAKIIFDYSHGQRSSYVEYIDEFLDGNLTEMGYEVVFASGGINSSILVDAKGLVIGSIFGDNGFQASEISAIASWYNTGGKFMWVGYDSDYDGPNINGNMTLVLEAVGSHVYGEPTFVIDQICNANQEYRVLAIGTSLNPMVMTTGFGVSAVIMHGSTLLYGSESANPGEDVNPVALETSLISNVYPILYYNDSAQIQDRDLILPYAHDDLDEGGFVAATMEFGLGPDDTNVLVVSGASPYGDYMPMYAYEYYGHDLTGNRFVLQTIDLGMSSTHEMESPVITLNHAGLQANTDIMVNATIVDASNISEALLFYSYDGMVTVSNTSMTHQSGDIWSATIPWPGYNTNISFMAIAEDSYGYFGVSDIYTIQGIESTETTTTETTTPPPIPNHIWIFLIAGVGVGVILLIVVVVIYRKYG